MGNSRPWRGCTDGGRQKKAGSRQVCRASLPLPRAPKSCHSRPFPFLGPSPLPSSHLHPEGPETLSQEERKSLKAPGGRSSPNLSGAVGSCLRKRCQQSSGPWGGPGQLGPEGPGRPVGPQPPSLGCTGFHPCPLGTPLRASEEEDMVHLDCSASGPPSGRDLGPLKEWGWGGGGVQTLQARILE